MAATPRMNLAQRIERLQAQRQRLADEITQIDATLRQIEQALGMKLRGRPARSSAGTPGPRRGRPRRRSFGISGLDSILGFVKENGQPTTAEINAHWTSEGRAGRADVALGKLVAGKQLKRLDNKGGRGSRYATA